MDQQKDEHYDSEEEVVLNIPKRPTGTHNEEYNFDALIKEMRHENEMMMNMFQQFMNVTLQRLNRLEENMGLQQQHTTRTKVLPDDDNQEKGQDQQEQGDIQVESLIDEEACKDSHHLDLSVKHGRQSGEQNCRIIEDSKSTMTLQTVDLVNETEKMGQDMNNKMSDLTGATPIHLQYGAACLQVFKTKILVEEERLDQLGNQKIASERLRRAVLHRKTKRNRQYQFRQRKQVCMRDLRPTSIVWREVKKFFPIYKGPHLLKKKCGENVFLLKDSYSIQRQYNAPNIKPYIPPDPGKFRN